MIPKDIYTFFRNPFKINSYIVHPISCNNIKTTGGIVVELEGIMHTQRCMKREKKKKKAAFYYHRRQWNACGRRVNTYRKNNRARVELCIAIYIFFLLSFLPSWKYKLSLSLSSFILRYLSGAFALIKALNQCRHVNFDFYLIALRRLFVFSVFLLLTCCMIFFCANVASVTRVSFRA